MKTMKPSRIGYADAIDHLYITFDGHDLESIDHEDEVGPWMTVQYSWPGGELAGIEVYGFKEHFGEPPMKLTVPCREPFVVDIPPLESEDSPT